VLLRIFSGGLRNVSVSSDYAIATLIAESQLAAAGIDLPLRPGETSGTEGERFEWTVNVQDYQPWPGYRSAAKGLDAYRVTVTVEWPHGDNTRSVGLSTVRLRTEGGIGS
jgi:general secretion pathway protein I